jgi:hypothetical protein
VCGVTSPGGRLQLSPPDTRVLGAGDALVLLAPELAKIRLLPRPMEVRGARCCCCCCCWPGL